MLTYEQKQQIKEELSKKLGFPVNEFYVADNGVINHISPTPLSVFEITKRETNNLRENSSLDTNL